MVKKLIIVVLLLITLPKGYAQGQFRKPLKPQGRANSSALSKYAIGVKGGCPWSVMPKSDLQMVSYDGYFGYAAGLVVESYFNRFSISLETLFSKKGTKMHYDYPYQTGFNTSAIFHRDFLLDFSTITARIPITYYFKGTFKGDKVIPYLFLGPEHNLHYNNYLRLPITNNAQQCRPKSQCQYLFRIWLYVKTSPGRNLTIT